MEEHKTTFVGEITEIGERSNTEKDGIPGIEVLNAKASIDTINRFGKPMKEICRLTFFGSLALLAEDLKPNSLVFLDECKVQNRPYESNGEYIKSQDIVVNQFCEILSREEYEEYKAAIEKEDSIKTKLVKEMELAQDILAMAQQESRRIETKISKILKKMNAAETSEEERAEMEALINTLEASKEAKEANIADLQQKIKSHEFKDLDENDAPESGLIDNA